MTGPLVIDPPRIRRLREALDEVGYDRLQRALRGSHPRTPHPPYAEFSETLRRIDPGLRPWFDLLTLGRSVPSETARRSLGGTLDDLLELGMLRESDGRVRSRGLGLACHLDRYVVARLDQLYPTVPRRPPDVYIGHSSYRLAAELPYGRRFDRALDICAGSGFLAILLARNADRVVAAELLDDAVNAARFNVILNRVEEVVEVRQGDLFAPVAGERFDLVVFNSPFVTSPPGIAASVLAYGGPQGTDTLGPLLTRLGDHMTSGGEALAYFESEGDRSGPLIACRLAPLVEAGGLDVELTLVDRSSLAERLRQLRRHFERRGETLPAAWADHYRAQGAHHYYAMVARFRPGGGRVTTVTAIPRFF